MSQDHPEWLQMALIYAAGLELADPMAYLVDHYGLRPEGIWFPRGTGVVEVGTEVDMMISTIDKSLNRAQSLMSLAHAHPEDLT